MIVEKTTWHYRVWKLMQGYRPEENPSVCDYWATVCIGAPLAGVIFGVVVAALSPFLLFAWLWKKAGLPQEIKTPKCPWGKVEFK